MSILIINIMSICNSSFFALYLLLHILQLSSSLQHMNKVFVSLACIYFKQCVCFFRIIATKENPSMRFAFPALARSKFTPGV